MNRRDFEWLQHALKLIRDDIADIKNDAKQARQDLEEARQLVLNLKFKFGFLASTFGACAGLLVKIFWG